MTLSVDRTLISWVNSLETPACLSVKSLNGLCNGEAIIDILIRFERKHEKTLIKLCRRSICSSSSLLQSSINFLGKKYGWDKLPPFLSRHNAAEAIILGEERGMRDLVQFLYSAYMPFTNTLGKENSRGNRVTFNTDVNERKPQSFTENILSSNSKTSKSLPSRNIAACHTSVQKKKKKIGKKNIQKKPQNKYKRPLLGRGRVDSAGLHLSGMIDPTYKLDKSQLKRLQNSNTSELKGARVQQSKNKTKSYAQCQRVSTKEYRTKNARKKSSSSVTLDVNKKQDKAINNDIVSSTYNTQTTKAIEYLSITRRHKKENSKETSEKFPDEEKKAHSGMGIRTPNKLLLRHHGILQWVSTLIGHLGRPVLSMRDAGIIFRDGVLLCNLVSCVFEIPSSVKYFNSHPHTQLDCLQNLNVALSALRSVTAKNAGMPQQYLWCAKELEKGNPKVLFGLLSGIRHVNKNLQNSQLLSAARKQQQNTSYNSQSYQKDNDGSTQNDDVSNQNEESIDLENDANIRVRKITNWLYSIQPNLLINASLWGQGDILQDRFRNGLLLCEIASELKPDRGVEVPHKKPVSLAAVRENIAFALAGIDSSVPPRPPSLTEADGILRGGGAVMWRLLWLLMSAGGTVEICEDFLFEMKTGNPPPNVVAKQNDNISDDSTEVCDTETSSIQEKKKNEFTSYTPKELNLLEQSLLLWLWDLGILDRKSDGRMPQHISKNCIGDSLLNGTFLGELVEIVTDAPMQGINKKPQSTSVAKRNFCKSLQQLRRQPRMGKRYVNDVQTTSEQLLIGNRLVWLQLLEDCHRLDSGAYPRPVHPKRKEMPYFGRFVPVSGHRKNVPLLCTSIINQNNPILVPSETMKSKKTKNTGTTIGECNIPEIFRSNDADIVPRPFSSIPGFPGGPTMSVSSSGSRNNSIMKSSCKSTKSRCILSKTCSIEHYEKESPDVDSTINTIKKINRDKNVARQSAAEEKHISRVYDSSRKKSKPLVRVSENRWNTEATTTNETHNTVLTNCRKNIASAHDVADAAVTICEWFDKLCIPLPDPSTLTCDNTETFRDGLLLCRLVQRLEHIRGTLPGVDRNPKAGASCLNNIRKALEVLRRKKNMPLDYLWSEEEIRSGNCDVVRKLLMQVRKAYGFHLRPCS